MNEDAFSEQLASRIELQDYSTKPTIEGVVFYPLNRAVDDGGSFMEVMRLNASGGMFKLPEKDAFQVRQVNYSITEPGAIKAYHLHPTQTDIWFVPPSDRLLMVLVDVRRRSPTEGTTMRFMLGYGLQRLVRIPPGVAHGCRNMSERPGQIIYFVDRHFSTDPGVCEEGRLPWDHFGAGLWEMTRG